MLPGIDEKGQYGCIGSADPANIVLVFLSVTVPMMTPPNGRLPLRSTLSL